MTGSPFPGGWDRSSGGAEAGSPYGDRYPGYTDPAYASQTPYGPTYQGPAPTERLPQYGPYQDDPYATGHYGAQHPVGEPPPPEDPGSPWWLWTLAGVGVVAVIGLVIALVVVNSSRQQTVVAPLPATPEPAFETPSPTTTSPSPTVPVLPLPTLPTTPPTTGTTQPGVTETVVYQVSGQGRALNITYVDTGGLLQTEFNAILPWRKEVQLAEPAAGSASISIINVGREVNCSITIDGALVQQRTGAGLTICTGTG